MMATGKRGTEINAADVEHIGALVTGGLLLLSGTRRSGAVGKLLRFAGFAFIYRGQRGYRRLYDVFGIRMPATPTGVGRQNIRVDASIQIQRPPQDVYKLWRNLENLPVFMDHLLAVHEVDDVHSIWVSRAPAGMVVKWDAEIINDKPNEMIAWQSLEGSGVDIAGSVHFDPLRDNETNLRVVLRYDPPADLLGYWIAKLFNSNPQKQIESDLERFKAFLEVTPFGERKKTLPSKQAQAL